MKEKTFEECISAVSGVIEKVVGRTEEVGYTPTGRVKLGGISPRDTTGHSNKLEITLKNEDMAPVKNKTPVRRLIFNGICPIEKGDEIKAYVLKGKFHVTRTYANSKKDERIFFDRDFQEEEIALYIEKLNEKGKVARIDYSVDYTH